jgi:hypothetical protein
MGNLLGSYGLRETPLISSTNHFEYFIASRLGATLPGARLFLCDACRQIAPDAFSNACCFPGFAA